MLSLNLLISKIPFVSWVERGRGTWIRIPTFDAKSKSGKIQNFLFPGGGQGKGVLLCETSAENSG